MRFGPSEEQAALQAAARGFLAELPGPHAMAEDDGAYAAEAWSRIVAEQGWPAIAVPADAGGWGFGMFEAALVFEEVGRRQTPCPLFATTALATPMILATGTPVQQARLLAPVLEGGTATVALDADVAAERHGDAWRLSGEARRVVDGHTADFVLVPTGEGVFAVRREQLAATRTPTLDPTRPMASVRFRDVEVAESDRLAGHGQGEALSRAAVLLAAEQVGGAEAVMDLAVEYAKVRVQFGKPIGTFQAIQHACADMLVRVESARSAVWYAAWALDQGLPDAPLACHTAKALASEAFFANAGASIQAHGGIGFTWEHALHLYFKRARSGLSLLGEPKSHRAAVARLVVDGEGAWT